MSVAEVEIRQIFKLANKTQIAGCFVVRGTVRINSHIRILRKTPNFPRGEIVWTGYLASLRQYKTRPNAVMSGNVCGMSFQGFNRLKPNDIIEVIY